MTSRTVLLFRSPQDSADPFEQILTESGYIPVSIPVLQFNYLNIETLADCLLNHGDYSSIVFTSQRSVEAVERALSLLKGLEQDDSLTSEGKSSSRPPCLDTTCFVVGPGTCKAAAHLGFNAQRMDAGHADRLADIMRQELPPTTRPVLYPCGNLRKETLGSKLRQSGFSVKEMEVYETGKSTDLLKNVENLIKSQGVPEYCVFFSPSGVKFISDLASSKILPLNNIKIVAIGPTTEKELIATGYEVHGVADSPDPTGILEALQKT